MLTELPGLWVAPRWPGTPMGVMLVGPHPLSAATLAPDSIRLHPGESTCSLLSPRVTAPPVHSVNRILVLLCSNPSGAQGQDLASSPLGPQLLLTSLLPLLQPH